VLLQSLSPGGLVTNILGYAVLVKFPFTFSHVLYAAPAPVNVSGESPSFPRDPGLPAK
jgi:hypothetical protein